MLFEPSGVGNLDGEAFGCNLGHGIDRIREYQGFETQKLQKEVRPIISILHGSVWISKIQILRRVAWIGYLSTMSGISDLVLTP